MLEASRVAGAVGVLLQYGETSIAKVLGSHLGCIFEGKAPRLPMYRSEIVVIAPHIPITPLSPISKEEARFLVELEWNIGLLNFEQMEELVSS